MKKGSVSYRHISFIASKMLNKEVWNRMTAYWTNKKNVYNLLESRNSGKNSVVKSQRRWS